MTATGLYVYGVVGAGHPCRLAGLTGVGGPARSVAAGPVTAVVGDATPGLRAKRRHLAAHHAVVESLARQGTVLPMRFGVVSPDEETLRRELTTGADRYQALLSELAGRVELNVKAFPDEEWMLREVVRHEPTVRALRSRASVSLPAQVELGQAVAAALATRQSAVARDVLARLEPLAVRSQQGPPVPGCAVNAGFLVEAGRAGAFAAEVDALRRELDAGVALRCTGPLPAYSFVTDGGASRWAS
ncbi:MAG TPA: GvpL/GvpF family gas vesicle protein [Mycobacteriales bacterium]|nr:GvpL/GvpF family gas vesicle protein [Mycobacteriales bacterium]